MNRLPAATGYKGQFDQVFARGAMVTGCAMLVGTVSGGLLGEIDLAVPYLARAAILVTVFLVALTMMKEVGFTPRAVVIVRLPGEMKRVARASVSHGWRVRSARLLMVAGFVQWGFISWGFYAWQPYFMELLGKQVVWAAGLFASLIALSMIAGNALVDGFSRYCGKRSTLLLWAAAVQTAAAVGVGLTDSFWLASALFLLTTGTLGVTGPVKQAYLHQVVPSSHRASVMSFESMMGNAGGAVGQAGLWLPLARSISRRRLLRGRSGHDRRPAGARVVESDGRTRGRHRGEAMRRT